MVKMLHVGAMSEKSSRGWMQLPTENWVAKGQLCGNEISIP
jgi:hypothetical protein